MFQRLVVVSALFGILAQAAPALEQVDGFKIALVATPSRFADQKQVYEIPTSDVFVNVKYGNSVNNSVILTLEATQATGSATSYVYGSKCTGNGCPDPQFRYDNSGTNKGAITGGSLQGDWYQDSITIGQNAKISDVVFASLSQLLSTEQFKGQISLGLGTNQIVDKLFALGKDPYITIYSSDKDNSGQLVIGRNGHGSCNDAVFWTIASDKTAWDVEKATIEVDGNSAKDQRLSFSRTQKQIIIPTDQYNAVLKDAKFNAGYVDDISKLKSIKITIDSTTYTLEPKDFTDKEDNGYYLNLSPSTNNNPAITLGTPFLSGRCLVLNGKDTDVGKWQVGVGDAHTSGAGIFGLSALLLSFASVFHVFRF